MDIENLLSKWGVEGRKGEKNKHVDIDPYGEEEWELKKDFEIGDEVICVNYNLGHLPEDAQDFLVKWGIQHKHTIKDINQNGKIYLGFNKNKLKYFFSPSRFKKM